MQRQQIDNLFANGVPLSIPCVREFSSRFRHGSSCFPLVFNQDRKGEERLAAAGSALAEEQAAHVGLQPIVHRLEEEDLLLDSSLQANAPSPQYDGKNPRVIGV